MEEYSLEKSRKHFTCSDPTLNPEQLSIKVPPFRGISPTGEGDLEKPRKSPGSICY